MVLDRRKARTTTTLVQRMQVTWLTTQQAEHSQQLIKMLIQFQIQFKIYNQCKTTRSIGEQGRHFWRGGQKKNFLEGDHKNCILYRNDVHFITKPALYFVGLHGSTLNGRELLLTRTATHLIRKGANLEILLDILVDVWGLRDFALINCPVVASSIRPRSVHFRIKWVAVL